MENKEIKIKALVSEIKDVNTNGQIVFAFNKFGNLDTDKDRTFKGSFTKTITENFKRIFHNLNHDSRLRPGIIKGLFEEGDFAFADVKLNLDIPLGREVYSQEKFFFDNGQPLEHSYKYEMIKFDKNEFGGFDIREQKLYEVSTLYMHGANEMALTTDVKQAEKDFEQRMILLENYIKSLQSDIAGLKATNQKQPINMQKLTQLFTL